MNDALRNTLKKLRLSGLLEGLEVFVGFEPLVIEGLTNGAAGAVSGLAAAFPEVVASLVHERDRHAHSLVERLALSGPFGVRDLQYSLENR